MPDDDDGLEDRELVCPQCKAGGVGENESIPGTAQGAWFVNANGVRSFEPSGYTEVCWDGQEVVEAEPCICASCGWMGTPGQLVVPDPDE